MITWRSMALLVPVVTTCWSQQTQPQTYRSVYLDRVGKTVDSHLFGGYLFEEIYDQPRTPGQPYYPILKVSKDGKVIRVITPDDIPIDDLDCDGGTCAEIRANDPTFEFRNGPCFGKAIFDGPTLLAYAPQGNVFYFYITTESPALSGELSFIIYYADLDSNELFQIGKTWAAELDDGKVSAIDEAYITFRIQYQHMGETVGLPLRVMDIANRSEKTFPNDLNLPKDQFPFYSVHSFMWLDADRIQMEIYAYKDYPGDEETLKGATIQTVIYDMKASTQTIAAPRKNTVPLKSSKRVGSASVPARRKPKTISPRPKSEASKSD